VVYGTDYPRIKWADRCCTQHITLLINPHGWIAQYFYPDPPLAVDLECQLAALIGSRRNLVSYQYFSEWDAANREQDQVE